MGAGKFRNLVTIENPDLIPEDTGGQQAATVAGEWKSDGKIWAQIKGLTARERLLGGQLDTGMSSTVTIRPSTKVTARTRFDWAGRKLYVVGPPILDERNTEMTLTCEERRI